MAHVTPIHGVLKVVVFGSWRGVIPSQRSDPDLLLFNRHSLYL